MIPICRSNIIQTKIDGVVELLESSFENLNDSEQQYLLYKLFERSGFDGYVFYRNYDLECNDFITYQFIYRDWDSQYNDIDGFLFFKDCASHE